MPDPDPRPVEPLLKTKLFIPPARLSLVSRPHLMAQLNAGMERRLTLISAPAGFGKTTLLAEWVHAERVHAESAHAEWVHSVTASKLKIEDQDLQPRALSLQPINFAWISLDPGDNDPARFLSYLVHALHLSLKGADPEIIFSALGMLQSPQPIPPRTILSTLVNDLISIPNPIVLILDDYQFITNPAVNEAVAFLLEHMPPQMHLVIATRADPLLPLARLRGRSQLLELRTDDLRFTPQESAAFLNAGMGLDLSPTDIEALEARTEGWIVGLQMAALAMQSPVSIQGRADIPGFIQAFSGSHRYILEYLVEEVFNHQPEEVQAFLLQTSILERLNGELCDAVLGEGRVVETRPSSSSAGQILDYLARANLFLIPLDETGYWYRYHHLFADLLQNLLRQRMSLDTLLVLHGRASRWFEQKGFFDEAIQHALAAREFEYAARLLHAYIFPKLTRGELSTFLTWLKMLPADLVQSQPQLCIDQAWASTFAGQLDGVEHFLQQAEHLLPVGELDPEIQEMHGSIASIRAVAADMQGDTGNAVHFARLADSLLPAGSRIPRSIIPFILGRAYRLQGDLEGASQAFTQIIIIGRAAANIWTIVVGLCELANVRKLQGRLREAAGLYEQAFQAAAQYGGQMYGTTGPVDVGLSEVLYHWNDLASARRRLEDAIQRMQSWGPNDSVYAFIVLARVLNAQGDLPAAWDVLEQASRLCQSHHIFLQLLALLEALRVRLWLAQGSLAEAARWAEERYPSEWDGRDMSQEPVQIALARLRLAQGRFAEASALLARLAGWAEAGGRSGRLVEILALSALACQAQGTIPQALSLLQKCLSLAAPEGYVRLFLDEGQPMKALLLVASRLELDPPIAEYVQILLEEFGETTKDEGRSERARTTNGIHSPPVVRPSSSSSIVDPLTPRELEVLQLICRGCSNQEIAEKLVVSLNTVKRHNNNLFAKLGVTNRAQAILRAQQLNLVDDDPQMSEI